LKPRERNECAFVYNYDDARRNDRRSPFDDMIDGESLEVDEELRDKAQRRDQFAPRSPNVYAIRGFTMTRETTRYTSKPTYSIPCGYSWLDKTVSRMQKEQQSRDSDFNANLRSFSPHFVRYKGKTAAVEELSKVCSKGG